MKYQANPVIVDALLITQIVVLPEAPGVSCELENGEWRQANSGMLARFAPAVGDYWVVQSDGYAYLNPKDVFERKYSPVPVAG